MDNRYEKLLDKLFSAVHASDYLDKETDVFDDVAHHNDFKNYFYELFGESPSTDEPEEIKFYRNYCALDFNLIYANDDELNSFDLLRKKKEIQKYQRYNALHTIDIPPISEITLDLGIKGIINRFLGIKEDTFSWRREQVEADKLMAYIDEITRSYEDSSKI